MTNLNNMWHSNSLLPTWTGAAAKIVTKIYSEQRSFLRTSSSPHQALSLAFEVNITKAHQKFMDNYFFLQFSVCVLTSVLMCRSVCGTPLTLPMWKHYLSCGRVAQELWSVCMDILVQLFMNYLHLWLMQS